LHPGQLVGHREREDRESRKRLQYNNSSVEGGLFARKGHRRGRKEIETVCSCSAQRGRALPRERKKGEAVENQSW